MAENGSPAARDLLSRVAIVFMEPKYPENIGSAARIAMNMGISRLIVVRKEPPDREKMLKMATHKAAHLIENMELHDSLVEALAPFAVVVGTTARLGGHRQNFLTPRELPAQLMPLLKENQVALLFGPEHRGLTNNDLQYCRLLTTIPTADFTSLNLAQAVAIHCYELFSGFDQLINERQKFSPKVAEIHELEGMYEHVGRLLQKIGFFKDRNYGYWMQNIRDFLGRLQLQAKEVRIIRGFCRQFLWYDGRQKKVLQGRNEKQKGD